MTTESNPLDTAPGCMPILEYQCDRSRRLLHRDNCRSDFLSFSVIAKFQGRDVSFSGTNFFKFVRSRQTDRS